MEKVDTAGKFLKITTLYFRPALPFLHSLARHIEFTFAMGIRGGLLFLRDFQKEYKYACQEVLGYEKTSFRTI